MKKHINLAIFLPNLNIGGVQKKIVRLANALVKYRHVDITLLVSEGDGVVRKMLDEHIRLVDLQKKHVINCVLPLTRYINRHAVDILLATKPNANRTAILAHRLAQKKPKLVISQPAPLSRNIKACKNVIRRALYALTPRLYAQADLIVGVSQGVAEDLRRMINNGKIIAIYNPVVDEAILTKRNELVAEEWLRAHNKPVVLSVGRLVGVKGFSTLIEAFAKLRKNVDARLMILGEGTERAALEKRIKELNLQEHVKLPGFAENPYAYMARADVFVFPSLREGLGNVLIEAMACKIPVVATDCDFGPREILADGKYGRLVVVGDAQALAEAMEQALADPDDLEAAYQRALDFSVEKIAKRYLEAFEALLGENED